MNLLSIVGARPQFIKAAALRRAISGLHHGKLLHTGQHYDDRLSKIFFTELGMGEPDINLGVGSASHAAQTAGMLVGIEAYLREQQPDWVVVFGDTNTTLAGALAAAKLHIPIAHVEAGLRSFNRRMPEEINRVLVDRLSTLLLCPGPTSVRHLAREGIREGVHIVGDIMADALACARERALRDSRILEELQLADRRYLLVTIHREENTDRAERLSGIVAALAKIEEPVVFPAHPRTVKALRTQGLHIPSHVRLMEPVGYLDMIRLAASARAVLTDSGGLQKEAYWLATPCLTLRDETEWVETVDVGWNHVVGCSPATILDTLATVTRPAEHPPLYGDGNTARRCVALLEREGGQVTAGP